jgi:predicted Fe-Mo cluster-binding NifX family protein
MDNQVIRYAFAVNHDGYFQPKHFGDADKYLIYEWDHTSPAYVKEILNPFKSYDAEHGSRKKGESIIHLLKSEDVHVLVSRQFGRNIQMVNRHFIPVIVYSEEPEESLLILRKHRQWIEDELKNHPEEYKLFTLRNGALKTIIRKEE